MHVSKDVAGDAEQLKYGLLRCRCFEFPVVDGVLLLSLAKGYGGAEEELQPYVPLQVASIEHLRRGDIAGLRSWIRRYLPLAAELMEDRAPAYLPFAARMAAELDRATAEYLIDHARFEVLGYPPPAARLGRLLGASAYFKLRQFKRRYQRARKPQRVLELEQLKNFYVSRFFSPRVNALALQLDSMPTHGRILSLCCGHGMFENLLARVKPADDVISIDGQFINLLATRRFVSPAGIYICHDVQFPLPFADGSFDGVFASNCLPEIPTQHSFISEALRVTRDIGWTLMDSIWSLEFGPGIQRVDRLRAYRFCQNFFARLADYVPFFEECAGPTRAIAVDIPGAPAKYRDGASWVFGRPAIDSAIEARTDWEVSVLVVTREKFLGFTAPGSRTWLSPELLALSPAFEVASITEGAVELVLRPGFGRLPQMLAPKTFMGLPERTSLDLQRLDDAEYRFDRFCEAVLVPLPRNFGCGPANLRELR